MELGKNIARIRKLNKLTSTQLAKLVGIKQPYLSQIEKGKRSPSLEVIQKIAQALDTTVSELLGEVPLQLSDDMHRLVNTARDLNTEQVNALISLVRELANNYGDNS
jgi:transcriptional regulator with XRE-family HTH domain